MIFDVYLKVAEQAGIDIDKMNINELFFKCLEVESDEYLYNAYLSALIYKTRGYAGRVYSQCKGHVPYEQCYDVLLDTINYVMKKRVWLNPESSLYNDPSAPDKAFHIVLKRQKGILLASLNTDKRVANFNSLSVDEFRENYNDATEGLLDIAENNSENNSLVNYISSKEPLEILILDQICFNNYTNFEQVAKNIKKLDFTDELISYYNNKYDMKPDDYSSALTDVMQLSIKKIVETIKKTTYKCGKDYAF